MKRLYFLGFILLLVLGCGELERTNPYDPMVALNGSISGFTAEQISLTEVELSWSCSAENELGFKVERKVQGGEYSEIGSTGRDVHSFVDSGVQIGTYYTYRVKVYKTEHYNYSDDNTVNIVFPAPSNVQAELSGNDIILTWELDIEEVENFTIERSENSGSYTVEASSVSGNLRTWTDIDVDVYSSYEYRIKSISSGYESAYAYSNDLEGLPEDWVYVEGGEFEMGAHDIDEDYADGDEYPKHPVILDDFYISKYEVTQGEYESVMGNNPSANYGVGDDYPVYYVTWYNAIEYCNELSMNDGLTPCYEVNGSTNPDDWGSYDHDDVTCNWSANGYRLPTEAEWEYAARGGQLSEQDYLYSGSAEIDEVAWYNGNSEGHSHEVGTVPTPETSHNELGIYDMSGNVWEWCWDRYDSNYYQDCDDEGSVSNPTGPVSGSSRVVRGGGWADGAKYCRSANRSRGTPSLSLGNLGFRLVRR